MNRVDEQARAGSPRGLSSRGLRRLWGFQGRLQDARRWLASGHEAEHGRCRRWSVRRTDRGAGALKGGEAPGRLWRGGEPPWNGRRSVGHAATSCGGSRACGSGPATSVAPQCGQARGLRSVDGVSGAGLDEVAGEGRGGSQVRASSVSAARPPSVARSPAAAECWAWRTRQRGSGGWRNGARAD